MQALCLAATCVPASLGIITDGGGMLLKVLWPQHSTSGANKTLSVDAENIKSEMPKESTGRGIGRRYPLPRGSGERRKIPSMVRAGRN